MSTFTIPFTPSADNEEIRVPIDDAMFVFRTQWNSKDDAWYLDVLQEDDTPILLGVKLVLGTIGKRCQHPFFTTYGLTVIDTTYTDQDAKFDDLGDRVILQLMTIDQIAGLA